VKGGRSARECADVVKEVTRQHTGKGRLMEIGHESKERAHLLEWVVGGVRVTIPRASKPNEPPERRMCID
jgi:hypothetical protein